MIVTDRRDGYWIRGRHGDNGSDQASIDVSPLPEGLSMLTAYDLNDPRSPRMRRYLPRFRSAPPPDPDAGDWSAWQALLAARDHDPEAGPGGAMAVVTDTGFGTVSSALIAIPAANRPGVPPIWLFAAGRPGEADYAAVDAVPHHH
jgi:hypothetical protein